MFNLLSFCSAGQGLYIYAYMALLLCEYIFQNIELNAVISNAHANYHGDPTESHQNKFAWSWKNMFFLVIPCIG